VIGLVCIFVVVVVVDFDLLLSCCVVLLSFCWLLLVDSSSHYLAFGKSCRRPVFVYFSEEEAPTTRHNTFHKSSQKKTVPTRQKQIMTSFTIAAATLILNLGVLLLLLNLSSHTHVEAVLPRLRTNDLYRLAAAATTAGNDHPPPHKEPLPQQDTFQNAPPSLLLWTSLNPQMEYLPASSLLLPRRNLEGGNNNNDHNNNGGAFQFYYEDLKDPLKEFDDDSVDNNPYRVQPFTSGVNDYDEYQQAWRMLRIHDGL
jgi:hypothetical protein